MGVLNEKRCKYIEGKRHNQKENGEYNEFVCEICNKSYGSFNGIEIHRKKCAIKTVIENKQVQNALEILKLKPLENKNIVININNTNNTINQQINIQNILNEKCTKTPNFIDYFNTLKINNDDIHKVYHENFAKTIITIIKNHLEKLPREKWPIFCINEQTFIKDKNEWKNENIENIKIFINKIYDIIYKKYIENNLYNDKYREQFIYKEIRRVMNDYIKDIDLCSIITKKIIKYVSTNEDDFLRLFIEELVIPENKIEYLPI